ncbi:MAG: ATP-binding protein [Candidatus Brocadiia bacterium]
MGLEPKAPSTGGALRGRGAALSGQPLPPEGDRQRVALVGIDEALRDTLRPILKDGQCEVLSPPDRAALLELAQENTLDLVLVDLDALGAEPGPLTRDIKSVAPQTMVMPVSSQASAEGPIEAMRAGAYDFFKKPCSDEELRRRVHRALENKRLGQQIKRRTLQLAFVNEISNAISASLDLRQVLQTAAAAVRTLIDFDLAAAALQSASAPTATLFPLTPDAETLWEEQAALDVAGTPVAEALEDSRPRLFADLGTRGPLAALEPLREGGFRSLIVLPLVSKGRPIGAFLLASRRPSAFSDAHVQVLQHVGGHLASAVENAQLYEQLKTLSSQLEETVAERTREVFDVKTYLENLVETAGDAILTLDLEGHIESWNKSAQEILGYTKEQARGRSVLELASGEGAKDQLATTIQRAAEGRITTNMETPWQRRDRKEVTVSLTVSPIRGGEDEIGGILTVARDITERRKLQEELFHSEKLASIGQLAAGVAHQINNPLGAISGRAQMLLRLPWPLDGEFLKEQIRKVQADCARITETVNDLLGFARKTETVKQYTDVNTVLDETLDMVKHEVIANKIRIERRYADNLPPVVASANHLRQLFANLMTNAFDAMEGGGALRVTTTFRPATGPQREQVVEIAVADTGGGIAEEELSRIFEPFYTTKPAGEGTGLGLAVAKRIVDFHNGHIEVESTVGKGTTFTIQFPAE